MEELRREASPAHVSHPHGAHRLGPRRQPSGGVQLDDAPEVVQDVREGAPAVREGDAPRPAEGAREAREARACPELEDRAPGNLAPGAEAPVGEHEGARPRVGAEVVAQDLRKARRERKEAGRLGEVRERCRAARGRVPCWRPAERTVGAVRGER